MVEGRDERLIRTFKRIAGITQPSSLRGPCADGGSEGGRSSRRRTVCADSLPVRLVPPAAIGSGVRYPLHSRAPWLALSVRRRLRMT